MSEHDLILSDLDGFDIDDFDPAEYIGNEQAVAVYLTEALETNDASMLAVAIGNVARARGMAEIAKASGLAREGLYKALRPNSQPRMETITRVLGALGVRLVAEVIPLAERKRELAVAPMRAPQKMTHQMRPQAFVASSFAAQATNSGATRTVAKSVATPTANSAATKDALKRPQVGLATKPAAAKPAATKSAAKRAK